MAKTYAPPSLTPKQLKAVADGDYDFLIPTRKPLMRIDEVCDSLRRSSGFVRALIDDGRLERHKDSATGERPSNTVTRRSLILHLAETSDYDPAYIVMRVEVVMKTLTGPALNRIIATAQKLRERIS